MLRVPWSATFVIDLGPATYTWDINLSGDNLELRFTNLWGDVFAVRHESHHFPDFGRLATLLAGLPNECVAYCSTSAVPMTSLYFLIVVSPPHSWRNSTMI